jgi:hypothetical protein
VAARHGNLKTKTAWHHGLEIISTLKSASPRLREAVHYSYNFDLS